MTASSQHLHFVRAHEIFGALEPAPVTDGSPCQIQYVLVPFAGLCSPALGVTQLGASMETELPVAQTPR